MKLKQKNVIIGIIMLFGILLSLNFISAAANITTTLVDPASGKEETDGIVDFYYNVTDATHIVDNCSLYFDNVLEETDTSISRNVTQDFHIINIKPSNSLEWYVSCYNNITEQGNSSTWTLDTHLGSSAPTSVSIGAGGVGIIEEINETTEEPTIEEPIITEKKGVNPLWIIGCVVLLFFVVYKIAEK